MIRLENDPGATLAERLERQARESLAHEALVRAANARNRGIAAGPAAADLPGTPQEAEFIAAMAAYQASSGRMFPTWSEVLEVFQELGYSKPCGPSPAP